MAQQDTIRGYASAIKRERIERLDPRTILCENDPTAHDKRLHVAIWSFTDTVHLVEVAQELPGDGCWIWTGCSAEGVLAECERMYGVTP